MDEDAQGFQAVADFGPYEGWKVQDMEIGSDGKARVLWSYEPGSVASLWRVDAPYSFTYRDYGNAGGYEWKPRAVAVSAP